MSAPACHVCGKGPVVLVAGYDGFRRVTSDCKPWPGGGQLAVCPACECAQAVLDARWHAEAKAIYDAYTIYHTSQGVEQSVFDQASGQATTRSARLMQRVMKEVPLPPSGRMLDIGCGNGAMIRAFSQLAPNWKLAGVEVNDHYCATVQAIPGVERLYVGDLDVVPGQFQLISLLHALEHIPEPRAMLTRIWDKLEPGGLLLIEVPDCAANPFMFLVADHSSHFFVPVLRELVRSAGFEVIAAVDNWVAKEITIVARKGLSRAQGAAGSVPAVLPAVTERLKWLEAVRAQARAMSAKGNFGLFGTSIAATWLYGELDGKVEFFVDEDPSRIGKQAYGRPIYRPADIPAGGEVLLALPTPLALQVKERLENLGNNAVYVVPPPVP